jgi:hypothetical protein
MQRLTTSRVTRLVATILGVSLVLSACSVKDLLRLSEPSVADQGQPAGRTPDRDDGTESDDEGADDGTNDTAGQDDTTAPDTGADPGGQGGTDQGDDDQPDGSAPAACDHVISASVEEADGHEGYADVEPGQTVCISAGVRGPLELHNFHGAPGQTITFVNQGGTVDIRGGDDDYAGIEIENSDHIRVTGAGMSRRCGADIAAEAQRCGIRILGPAHSVTGKVRTEYITIDHVEMGDTTQSAVSIKDNSLGRGEWVEHDVVLNRNYIHDVRDEGVYIGSSDYASGDYHVLHGVHLGHNLVVDTGRDGLQVGSATRNCTIQHNVVKNSGRNNESSHRAGVMNNQGSVCDIYNNFVADTAGWGIYVQGNGANEIYNNVVVRAGRSVRAGDGDGDGISVHDGSNVNGSISVWNNTVVSASGDGIGWGNDAGSDNQIRNNLVVDSGGVNIDTDENVQVARNFTSQTVAAARFVDAATDDYHLRSDSPARDAGVNLHDRGVVDDHDGVARPQGSAYDIGAYELRSSQG